MNTTTIAAEVRERILRSRDRFWRPEDFDGSPEAVAQALSRLERTGELRRVRRGLNWVGSPTRLGMAPPPPGRLAGEGHVRSLWKRTGRVERVPGTRLVHAGGCDARRSPCRRGPRVARTPFISSAGPRPPSAATSVLRSTEVALFEVLRDWDRLVEVPATDAVDRIARLAESGEVRLDRLARGSATEPPRARASASAASLVPLATLKAEAVRPARSASVHRDLMLAG